MFAWFLEGSHGPGRRLEGTLEPLQGEIRTFVWLVRHAPHDGVHQVGDVLRAIADGRRWTVAPRVHWAWLDSSRASFTRCEEWFDRAKPELGRKHPRVADSVDTKRSDVIPEAIPG
jgi:hypothetical protein